MPYYPVTHKLKKTVSLTKSRWAGGRESHNKVLYGDAPRRFFITLRRILIYTDCVTLPPFLLILTS